MPLLIRAGVALTYVSVIDFPDPKFLLQMLLFSSYNRWDVNILNQGCVYVPLVESLLERDIYSCSVLILPHY